MYSWRGRGGAGVQLEREGWSWCTAGEGGWSWCTVREGVWSWCALSCGEDGHYKNIMIKSITTLSLILSTYSV